MESGIFVQRKGKLPSWTLVAIPRCMCVSDMSSFRQTMRWFGPWTSSFALKIIQPRTWYVVSGKGLSEKLAHSRFEFFLTTRSHRMMPHEGFTFFWFFWISYTWFGTHARWRHARTLASGQTVRSLAWTERILPDAIVQTLLFSSEIDKSFRQMRISPMSYMWARMRMSQTK
jgi:hypothetical protein